MIKENLSIVEEKIMQACKRSGRDRSEITLIAVSKTKPVGMIQEAMECGAIDFGENKAQELKEKAEQIEKPLHWHFIGHLQRNKVKYIIDKVNMIHSVDSIRLAEAIEAEAAKINRIIPVLIEINIAEEESKYGIKPEEAEEFLRKISIFPHIQTKGLMTIAPYVEKGENNRNYFKEMHKLSVDIAVKNINNIYMDVLSMGMTGDYEAAIEEGATMVRIGTGIFGERNYIR